MSTTHKLEEQLLNLQYTFATHFEQDIMQELKNSSITMWPKISWLLSGIAASIVLFLSLIYIQNGTISVDAVLGVTILNDTNYNDILTYYQS